MCLHWADLSTRAIIGIEMQSSRGIAQGECVIAGSLNLYISQLECNKALKYNYIRDSARIKVVSEMNVWKLIDIFI